jgi:hypothetical protein
MAKLQPVSLPTEMETRKRGSVNHTFRTLQTKAEVPSQTAEVPATKAAPKTLGKITKQETKVHRKRVLRNKVQKAK